MVWCAMVPHGLLSKETYRLSHHIPIEDELAAQLLPVRPDVGIRLPGVAVRQVSPMCSCKIARARARATRVMVGIRITQGGVQCVAASRPL